jgi:PKD repeat protein
VVNDAPIANFLVSSIDTGCVIAPTQFTDLSTGSGRAIVGWNWEFGDGSISTTQSPAKTYATAGDYNAKLTAITDFGCVASKTVPINLSNKPIASFTTPAITCINSAINFTDASTIVPGTANNTISTMEMEFRQWGRVIVYKTMQFKPIPTLHGEPKMCI